VVSNADLFAFLAGNTGLDGSFGQGVTGSTVQAGQRRLEMVGGDAVGARLVIAADGRNSTLRREDGIQRQQQDFGQIALTGVIRHEAPHEGRAFQRFLRGGTFALLPLPADDGGEGYASSFIWVERMQSRFGDALGRLSKTDNEDWAQFPLLAHSCDRIIGERLALIGEAAHSIHPLAGQGLNLSIKDAAALTEALVEQRRFGLDPGDAQALERYQRARRSETARMSSLTTGLNGLFSRPGGPMRAAAAVGLRALDRMGPLKALLEREARR
jgi:2-octaprenyl-6-methoxyphenol hydroxylase